MADLTSLDGILSAFYEGVSGPVGFAWDREAQRALYRPGAPLVRLTRGADGRARPTVMDVDSHMDGSAEYLASTPFHEAEVERRTERFGDLAHVWSRYEARHAPDDPEPIFGGVNSIQLYWDGERWWITAVIWQNEGTGVPDLRDGDGRER